MTRPLKDRFDEKFRVTPGCWIWLGAKLKEGYGIIHYKGKLIGAHRASYELYVGEIPDGLIVRHKCDTPSCVNPDHLVIGTHKENAKDRGERGRASIRRGSKNHMAKLDESQILHIRADNRSQTAIAKEFGVSRALIGYIKKKSIWNHI